MPDLDLGFQAIPEPHSLREFKQMRKSSRGATRRFAPNRVRHRSDHAFACARTNRSASSDYTDSFGQGFSFITL
jgi:hypothetical protein